MLSVRQRRERMSLPDRRYLMAGDEVTREVILQKLVEILEAQGVTGDDVVDEAYFNVEHKDKKNLGLDSLDLVEMVMEFEDGFGIKISDDDSMKLQTVGDAVDYLYGRRAELTIAQTDPAK